MLVQAWLETFGHTSGPASISPHTKNQPVENDLEDDDDSDVDDDDDEEEEDEDDDEGYALHGHSDSAIGSKRTGHFDEGDAKRIRRMEANREAARQTIRRRREQYDGMLSQEKKLEEDNAALCKDIEEVKSDIDMLTQNILWLRAAMKKIEDRRMEGKRWAAEARRAGEVEKRSDVLQQELEAQLRAEVHQRRMLEEHRASELRAAEDRICHPSSPQHFSGQFVACW